MALKLLAINVARKWLGKGDELLRWYSGSVQKLLALYETDSSLFWVGEGKQRTFIKDDTDYLHERTHKCVLCSLLPFWKVKSRSEQIMISSSHDQKPEPPLLRSASGQEEQEEDCVGSQKTAQVIRWCWFQDKTSSPQKVCRPPDPVITAITSKKLAASFH